MKRFLQGQIDLLNAAGFASWAKFNLELVRLRFRAHDAARRFYRVLSEAQMRQLRKSERVYVFGSGYSLNDITDAEWQVIKQHDSIGFNAFVHQRWIPLDIHLVRGWGEGANAHYNWKKEVGELGQLICRNPMYAETVILLQDEHFAQVSRVLLAENMLPKSARIAYYKTAGGRGVPTKSLSDGLRHMSGTLSDAVNLAYCLGWREIVLVGVDLYDTRYFWLNPDETFFTDFRTGERRPSPVSDRGQRYDQAHSTARSGVVGEMEKWGMYMAEKGVGLYVYNPRSLLAEVLPVFPKESAEAVINDKTTT